MELVAVLLGLAAAVSWGSGDFSGGIATKKNPVVTVILVSQCIGWTMLVGIALLLSTDIPALSTILYSILAGLVGVMGLLALYKSLSLTKMGVVAPVAAITSAVLPVLVGGIIEGLPPLHNILGFCFALGAVVLLTMGEKIDSFSLKDLWLPFLAGCGFGLYFIIIDRVADDTVLWPLVIMRLTSIIFLAAIFAIKRPGGVFTKINMLVIGLAGILDISGNVFFALATRLGRLDVTSILGALYPVATIFLARLILKERLSRIQWIGVLCTMVALILITV